MNRISTVERIKFGVYLGMVRRKGQSLAKVKFDGNKTYSAVPLEDLEKTRKPRGQSTIDGEVQWICTKGHEDQCGMSMGTKCHCECGGKNHGKKIPDILIKK
ncbi:MAG: hypothetical protein WC788_08180 [Candidatus Paceibacterota bacterium]